MKTGKFVQISIRFALISLTVSLAFTSSNIVSSIVKAQNTDHPWPQSLQNPQLTSFNDGPAPRQPAILWTHTFPNTLSFSVASSYGKLFVPCGDRQVYALNESSGQTIWNYTLPILALNSPAVADGKVFVSSGDGNLYALDEATGNKIWNYTLGLPFFTYMPAPTVADGVVFASSFDSKVYALNRTTGSKIWNFTTDSYILGGISVSGENVFIADIVNLYALNKGTGNKIWNYTVAGSLSFFSPVVASNRILVANGASQMLAIDQFTGNKVWNFTVDGSMYASPAVAYDKIFLNSIVNANLTSLYALDLNGNQIWKSQISASTVFSAPAIADGMVFVSSANLTYASLYAFSQSDGSKAWQYDNPLHYQVTSPIITDGKVIVSFNSTLTAFGIHDLAMLSLAVPPTAIPGEQVLINVTVENTGDFTESSTVTVYVNGTNIGTEPISDLAPNATTTVTFNWNTTDFEVGNYNVTASLATVSLERITSDNMITSWTAVGIHNLTMLNLTVPPTVNSGDQVTISVTVQNNGNFTESSSVTVYANYTSVDTELISNLAPGATVVLTFNWNTTGLQPGNCSIIATVQPVSMESTTSDNAQATTVKVNAPSAAFPPELIIGIVVAIVVVVAAIGIAVYLRRRKKKPEPPAPQTTETTQPPQPPSPGQPSG